jgi:hypothetical protein
MQKMAGTFYASSKQNYIIPGRIFFNALLTILSILRGRVSAFLALLSHSIYNLRVDGGNERKLS